MLSVCLCVRCTGAGQQDVCVVDRHLEMSDFDAALDLLHESQADALGAPKVSHSFRHHYITFISMLSLLKTSCIVYVHISVYLCISLSVYVFVCLSILNTVLSILCVRVCVYNYSYLV